MRTGERPEKISADGSGSHLLVARAGIEKPQTGAGKLTILHKLRSEHGAEQLRGHAGCASDIERDGHVAEAEPLDREQQRAQRS